MRFKSWTIDDSVSLSVLTPDACGVYVLVFTDGEEYVGQTRHLWSRFASHRRRWPGEICELQFSEVEPDRLDEAERDVIAMRERDGAKLRNVDLIGLPLRSPELDHYVDPVAVEDWLDGDMEASSIGERGALALQRRQTRRRYEELSKRPDYGCIRDLLARYLYLCIPYPHRTERKIWVVTSLPTTGRNSRWRRLAALSINNVEALVIGEEPGQDGKPTTCGFINLARFDKLPAAPSCHVWLEAGEYGKTGRVTRAWFDDLAALDALLADEVLLDAARRLAVGLLRKGGTMFARFHDFNLADDLFAAIETDEADAIALTRTAVNEGGPGLSP
ncbi:MAG: GIY-YIG nuclease family protein [Bifidobacteriaceae bacterium]|jgi:hypothetical protein|nr:GIY-YIG nuclease family protein [Bifidobacteriaceae bacterium]